MILYLEMLLQSETCFSGSGGGRIGRVDVDLETDPTSDLPIVRGRTLKGLLVEELALILRTLEPAEKGARHDAAAQLFGTRGETANAKLSFHDGQLASDLRAAVEENRNQWGHEEVLAALTTVRVQTKVNGDTGAPEPHSLRSTRLLRAGLRFRAAVRARETLTATEQALLAAATAGVRRAGLHRNHGWGEIALRLLDSTRHDVTAAWIAGIREPPSAALADIPAMPVGTEPPTAAQRVLSYRLTLTTPVVLATTGGDPSTVETRHFVSGASVLGAVASRWLARPCADPSLDPAFRRLFLDGSVRWLNAYPEGTDGARFLPRPQSLVQRKGDNREAFDKANPEFPRLLEDEPDTQWKPLDELPFVCFRDTEEEDGMAHELRGRQPGLTTRLHHTRDDREAGRSTDGAMFSYVALDAGERFVGHVLCETEEYAGIISELLTAGPLALGRSRTATYGGWAEVEIRPQENEADWQEAPTRQAFSDEEENRIVVTLLSDYLGVNGAGLPDPKALEMDIREALGITDPVARFLGTRSVGGYVSRWRMPRPVHPAVAAGSVLVYEDVRIDPERVRALHWQGIGTRRAEGYGRVVVQWHGALRLKARSDKPSARPSDVPSAPPSPELVLLRKNLLCNALSEALTARAVADAQQVTRPPSPSLIARLRGRVRSAAKPEEIRDFLGRASLRPEDKGLKTAGQALARARLGQKSMTEWLEDWMLGSEPAWTRCPQVTDESQRLRIGIEVLDPGERWQLLQTYLDAFCERLRRRAVEARAA